MVYKGFDAPFLLQKKMFNEFLETTPIIELPQKTSRATRSYLLQKLTHLKNQPIPIFKQYGSTSTTFQAEDAYLFEDHLVIKNSQTLIQLVNATREEQQTALLESLGWPCGNILQNVLGREAAFSKHFNYGLAALLFGVSSSFTPELLNYIDMYTVSQWSSIFSGVAPNLWHYTSLFTNSVEEMPIIRGRTFYVYRQTKLAYNCMMFNADQMRLNPEKAMSDAILWSGQFRREEFHDHVMNPEKQTTTLLKQALIMFQ